MVVSTHATPGADLPRYWASWMQMEGLLPCFNPTPSLICAATRSIPTRNAELVHCAICVVVLAGHGTM